MKYLAINYLTTSFYTDVLAVFPLFLKRGFSELWLSLRFFRLFRIKRILGRLDDFAKRIQDHYISEQILIDNLNMTLKTFFIIGFVLHGLACIFVFIG